VREGAAGVVRAPDGRWCDISDDPGLLARFARYCAGAERRRRGALARSLASGSTREIIVGHGSQFV